MDKKLKSKAELNMILSMIIFGSIGIFVKYIALPSGIISVARGFIGCIVLVVFSLVSKTGLSLKDIKNNVLLLFVSSAFIGVNWMLLFESYNYTSVAVSTLCYYMAPVFMIILSAVFLNEKLSLKKIICVVVSVCGMFLISGVFSSGFSVKEIKGVMLALGAALFYAFVTLFNKKLAGMSSGDKTIVQLFFAAVVILPYSIIKGDFNLGSVSMTQVILLITAGVIHTGFAYIMFFGSIGKLAAQTTAILCYIDPITAVILSSILLKEKLGVFEIAGAVLIIGASLFSEIRPKEKSTGKPMD